MARQLSKMVYHRSEKMGTEYYTDKHLTLRST